MADETDNHDLNTYLEGETGWSHSSDMEHIEERLTVRDTEANRSNYTPHSDARFIATDSGAVYDGDGSSWSLATRSVNYLEAGGIDLTGWEWFDVTNHGVDNTGTDDVAADIESVAEDGRVLFFPEGTYLFENSVVIDGANIAELSIIASPSAEFHYGASTNLLHLGDLSAVSTPMERLYVKGLDIYDPSNQGQRAIGAATNGYAILEDIEIHDQTDNDNLGAYRFEANGDGTMILNRLRTTTGAFGSSHATAIFARPNEPESTLKFIDCHIANWTDNGLYGQPSADGQIIVEGGVYKNNGTAQVRTGTPNTVIKDVTCIVDDNVRTGDGATNAVGIRIRDSTNHRVDNCYVRNEATGMNTYLLEIHENVGTAKIRDSKFVANDSDANISATAASHSDNARLELSGCEFVATGTSLDSSFAFLLINRQDAVVQNCTFDNDTDSYTMFFGGPRNTIRDCRVTTTVSNAAIRTSGEYMRILSNTVESPTQPIRVNSDTGQVIIKNNLIEGTIRDDGNNTITDTDNIDIS